MYIILGLQQYLPGSVKSDKSLVTFRIIIVFIYGFSNFLPSISIYYTSLQFTVVGKLFPESGKFLSKTALILLNSCSFWAKIRLFSAFSTSPYRSPQFDIFKKFLSLPSYYPHLSPTIMTQRVVGRSTSVFYRNGFNNSCIGVIHMTSMKNTLFKRARNISTFLRRGVGMEHF